MPSPTTAANRTSIIVGICAPLLGRPTSDWLTITEVLPSRVAPVGMSASLMGRLGSSVSDYPPLECRCRSRARASLRNRRRGRNNLRVGLVVQANDRSKRTCELTSSIVPRGTSFHCWVDLEFPPSAFDPRRRSCRGGFLLSPSELGAVNPDAVHDHGQPACQRHDRLLHPTVPGDLHRPGLEPGPFWRAHQ